MTGSNVDLGGLSHPEDDNYRFFDVVSTENSATLTPGRGTEYPDDAIVAQPDSAETLEVEDDPMAVAVPDADRLKSVMKDLGITTCDAVSGIEANVSSSVAEASDRTVDGQNALGGRNSYATYGLLGLNKPDRFSL